MPISLYEYQQGKVVDGSSKIVLDFLKSNRNQAFTQDEIIKGVNPNPTSESFIHFLTTMAPLQLQGLVERREVQRQKIRNCITEQHSYFVHIRRNMEFGETDNARVTILEPT